MKKGSLSLSLLWIGIVLLITGTIFTFFGIAYTTWAIVAIMGGALGVLVYIVINYDEVKNFLIEYSTRQWANMTIFIVLLLGIIILVQTIANRHNHRFDLTPEGTMSLAPITKKLLQDVSSPVKVLGFYRREERGEMDKLMELYLLASKKFSYELYDLDRNPGLAKKYGVSAYGTAVVLVKDKLKKVTYPTEEKIINAILTLISPEQKVVYFLTGHGEYTLEGLEEDTNSYGLLKQVLETENYLVKTLLLVGGKPVPEDASLVVTGGPKAIFTSEDVKSLDTHIRKGGRVIIAVDPGYEDGLKGMLKGYGIILGEDMVVDPENYLIEKNALVPIAPFYITHPITENFSIPTVFPLVRSVTQGTGEIKGVEVKSLARSGDQSWAETNVKDAEEGRFDYDPRVDQKGPITVALVGQISVEKLKEELEDKGDEKTAEDNKTKVGRVVVFGDSDFLLNHYFELLGNKDLFMNTVHWMTEDESLITIRRKKPSGEEAGPVYLSPLHSRMIFIGVVILQPIIVIAIGIVVAWRRRQRG